MLPRHLMSTSVLVLGLVAVLTTTGCAKRHVGSIKDDAPASEEAVRPTRKWTAPVHKVRAAMPETPRQLTNRAPTPPPASPAAEPPLAKAPPPAPPPASAPPQAKDAEPCESSERCAAQLRAMLNDASRSWIGKPQTVEEHFTGTRQFAYLALVKVLKCTELSAGLKDVQAAAQISATPGKYPAHRVAQIKELNSHVESELAKEGRARCPR